MAHDVTAPPEVVCTGLNKTYADGTKAVSGVDLTFLAGETTALVGPSGCGKSTLLRMIAGLDEASSGQITIGGAPPAETLRRAGLSMAFQDPSLLPWRSVRRNIELALRLAHRKTESSEIDRLISLVGLDGFADARPATLSGGMRQRAAIARALITRPGLLLLDEPFGAVDEITRAQLAKDLPAIWKARGTTTIIVTHSIHEAVQMSDRVIVLSQRPAEVREDLRIALPDPRPENLARCDAAVALIEKIQATLARGMAARPSSMVAE